MSIRNKYLDYRRRNLQLFAAAIFVGFVIVTAGVSQSIDRGNGDDPVVTVREQAGGTLGNQQIAAEWHLSGGHLAGLVIHNKLAMRSATISSLHLDEPFSIEQKRDR